MQIAIRATLLAAAAIFLSAQIPSAPAAELQVYSSVAVKGALEELASKFEKASGNRMVMTWGTAAMLAKRVQGGENPDVLILTPQSLEILIKEGKASATANPALVSSSIGVVVKAGSPKPDIATKEAFKSTLLAAKSISYSNPAAGGASGVFIAKLLERMGISEQIKAKTKFPPDGGFAATLVLSGEAEIAIQQNPEVTAVKGVDFVGILPGDYNSITVFSAGIGARSNDPTKSDQLIKFLHSPEATAVFKAHGLDPA